MFISGTSSRRPDDTHRGADRINGEWILDIKEQTRGTIEQIAKILGQAGCSLNDVVDVTVFLVSMNDFDGYNEAYAEYFDRTGPTRTTVAVHELPHPNLLIEIKAVAYSGKRS